MQLTGIHHLTAVSADASGNHAFYTKTLGMRLVKKTVNQDDVSAYHLFYADALASPGSDITFFDWPVGRERRGTHSITRTALRVAGDGTLEWWKKRFEAEGVRHADIVERDTRLVLDFEDFEGQRLSLVDDGGAGAAHPWDRSPIPAEYQIRGLGPITMSVPDLKPTDLVVRRVLNMEQVREYRTPDTADSRTVVYQMGQGGAAAELHVAVQPDLEPAGQGAGAVHHVAFRIPDADYEAWADRLNQVRLPSSGPVDRFYFRSLYFREPNGVLFEIATDGPGFATDEAMDALGEKLSLPPFLEGRRKQIEANLKPL
ncbi:glyoxalase [Skermanella aerolata]|uniref:Glyoxalase n=1 Tax=Skermanella aerolata TaxID=393310 RepID=A0A512DUZ9_9PROT|nr:ring-cleaving dioxygenase [Skermanella aerolata]GEO40289.1 glyoxalase [Skermanella aerolata]